MTFSERIGQLDAKDHAPLYRQLQKVLREAIESQGIGRVIAAAGEAD